MRVQEKKECEKDWTPIVYVRAYKKNRQGFLNLHETNIRIFVIVHPQVLLKYEKSEYF